MKPAIESARAHLHREVDTCIAVGGDDKRMSAVIECHLETIAACVRDRREDEILKDAKERGLAHKLVRAGYPRSLARLLATGVNPDSVDHEDETPIWCAVAGGSNNCFRVLLAAGADPLRDEGGHYSLLHFAAWAGTPVMVERLIKAGCQVNLLDQDGLSPLHWAVRDESRRVETVRILLAAGADLELRARGELALAGLRAIDMMLDPAMRALLEAAYADLALSRCIANPHPGQARENPRNHGL